MDPTFTSGEVHDFIALEMQESDNRFLELGLLQLLSNPEISDNQKSKTVITNLSEHH